MVSTVAYHKFLVTLRLRILLCLSQPLCWWAQELYDKGYFPYHWWGKQRHKNVTHKGQDKYLNHLPLLPLKACLWPGEWTNSYESISTLRSPHYLLWKVPRELLAFRTAESGEAILKALGHNFRKHGAEPRFSQHLFPKQYLSLCLSFYPNCTQYKSCHYSGKVAFQLRVHS